LSFFVWLECEFYELNGDLNGMVVIRWLLHEHSLDCSLRRGKAVHLNVCGVMGFVHWQNDIHGILNSDVKYASYLLHGRAVVSMLPVY